jgi:hypothetical protein
MLDHAVKTVGESAVIAAIDEFIIEASSVCDAAVCCRGSRPSRLPGEPADNGLTVAPGQAGCKRRAESRSAGIEDDTRVPAARVAGARASLSAGRDREDA